MFSYINQQRWLWVWSFAEAIGHKMRLLLWKVLAFVFFLSQDSGTALQSVLFIANRAAERRVSVVLLISEERGKQQNN